MKQLRYCCDYEGVVDIPTLLQQKVKDWTHIEAMVRYHWAVSLVAASGEESKVSPCVWDMGCGSGEGSRLLLAAGEPSIFAIDVYDAALDLARKTLTGSPVLVVRQDLCAPILKLSTLTANPPDVGLLFDVLPQLPHREFFFEQYVQHAKVDSILLLNGGFTGRPVCDPKPPQFSGYFAYDKTTLLRLLWRYFDVVSCCEDDIETNSDVFGGIRHYRELCQQSQLCNDLILCRYPIR